MEESDPSNQLQIDLDLGVEDHLNLAKDNMLGKCNRSYRY